MHELMTSDLFAAHTDNATSAIPKQLAASAP